jgi:hypothetical protein
MAAFIGVALMIVAAVSADHAAIVVVLAALASITALADCRECGRSAVRESRIAEERLRRQQRQRARGMARE